MNNAGGKRIKSGNIIFRGYFLYCLAVLGTEWFMFIASLLHVEVPTAISESYSAIFIAVTWYFVRLYFEPSKFKMNLSLFCGCLFILFLGFIMSVYPDATYDTYNYHLVAQSPRFTNFFTEHFAKGNFQVWGFRLGDRLFYYFRCLLGFRFGTLLNTVILIIAYIQIYYILSEIESEDSVLPKMVSNILCNKMIWAGVIVLGHDAILMIGTYYVDILALPIGLEILRILLTEKKEMHDIKDIGYFAILNGMWIAFKLTNIFYVIPCVLIYIFSHRKSFTAKTWILSIGFGALPFSVYLMNNFICTGNPIFPYFNKWFGSSYFMEKGFKDPNWGGTNLFEKLTWIFYTIFKPDYRQTEIYSRYNFIILLGVVAAIVFLVCRLHKWKYKICSIGHELPVLVIIAFFSTVLWSFSSGYGRYFIFGKIIWSILAYTLCLRLVSTLSVTGYAITGICAIIIVLQECQTGGGYIYGRNWSWRTWRKDTFLEQIKEVGKDRRFLNQNENDIGMFYLSDSYYSGIAHLIDDEKYTYIASYSAWLDDVAVMEDALNDHPHEHMGKKVDIYRRNLNQISEYVNTVNACGMYIDGFESIYHADMGDYLLVTIEESQDKSNTIYLSDEKMEISFVRKEGENVLEFICGRYYNWPETNHYDMQVYLSGNGSKEKIFTASVDNVDVVTYKVPLTTNECEFEIIYEFCNSKGELIDSNETNKIFIVNPRLYYSE